MTVPRRRRWDNGNSRKRRRFVRDLTGLFLALGFALLALAVLIS